MKTRKDVEITEMDSKLHEEYEDRLQKALNELRDVYDKQMAQNREDFSKLYETRVRDRLNREGAVLTIIIFFTGPGASDSSVLRERKGFLQ